MGRSARRRRTAAWRGVARRAATTSAAAPAAATATHPNTSVSPWLGERRDDSRTILQALSEIAKSVFRMRRSEREVDVQNKDRVCSPEEGDTNRLCGLCERHDTNPSPCPHIRSSQSHPKAISLLQDPKTEPEPTEEPPAKPEPLLTALYILLPLLLIALLAICAYWLVRRAQYYAMRRKQEAEEAGRGLDATQLGALSSGSGSLGQHRPIQLRHVVARGRFGHVYLADWAEKPVAVKIFPAADVDSWMQEQDIYAVEGRNRYFIFAGCPTL